MSAQFFMLYISLPNTLQLGKISQGAALFSGTVNISLLVIILDSLLN